MTDETRPRPGLRARIAVETADTRQLELDASLPEVLAIGSQLAYGSVGLNAALPVYSSAGIRVAAIPSIVLSVMPHYASVHQVSVEETWISAALGDLTEAGALERLRFVSVGYLAAPEQARAIADWYRGLPAESRPPLILDPTLGDEELGFYTDPALADAIGRWLLPVAFGLLPNRFELGHLAGRRADRLSEKQACIDAAAALLADDRHPALKWVVVTGLRPSESASSIGELIVAETEVAERLHPYLETRAKGQGDTFTAALTCELRDGAGIADAVEAAAAAVRQRIASN